MSTFSNVVALSFVVCVMSLATAGCGTALDPQQYVLRSEARAAEEKPAKQKVEDELIDDVVPEPAKRRKA
ncbi:MAG: hypothetical protein MI757_21355, partial [Pirellulales bacterium]|nr:hypothetical protein [Pirellulales bacterium]